MGPFFDPGERQGVPPSAVLQGAARRARCCDRAVRPPVAAAAAARRAASCCSDSATTGSCSAIGCREWCGHGPILEEDIALANVSLDLLGQATLLLQRAGEVEGKGRDEDALAYFREAVDFRNCLLVELPKGDFGFTIARQFLFDVYAVVTLDALSRSTNADLAAIAAKALKEAKYHVRHSGEWMLKLGDGTEESHRRVQRALDELWRLHRRAVRRRTTSTARLATQGIGADLPALERRVERRW